MKKIALLLLLVAGPAVANEFYAFDPAFPGGAHPADCGNIDTFGNRWLIVGAGPGGEPRVNAYVIRGGEAQGPIYSWLAYDPRFAGGVWVTCGVVGLYTVVWTGAGPGGGPHIRSWVMPGPQIPY
jgi:hypothetical protein